jgi:hypothetical protein
MVGVVCLESESEMDGPLTSGVTIKESSLKILLCG